MQSFWNTFVPKHLQKFSPHWEHRITKIWRSVPWKSLADEDPRVAASYRPLLLSVCHKLFERIQAYMSLTTIPTSMFRHDTCWHNCTGREDRLSVSWSYVSDRPNCSQVSTYLPDLIIIILPNHPQHSTCKSVCLTDFCCFWIGRQCWEDLEQLRNTVGLVQAAEKVAGYRGVGGSQILPEVEQRKSQRQLTQEHLAGLEQQYRLKDKKVKRRCRKDKNNATTWKLVRPTRQRPKDTTGHCTVKQITGHRMQSRRMKMTDEKFTTTLPARAQLSWTYNGTQLELCPN